jgi:branched-chain amino acid transport system permease protein
MDLLVNILIDGTAYAMVLFMITIGLSLTLGLMHVVNMAHGVFAMVAGLVAASLISHWGVNFLLATLAGLACAAVLAVPVERFLIRRFYKRSPMDQMLMTMGIVFIASATASALFGPTVVNVPLPEWLSGGVQFAGRQFPAHRLMVIVVGVATLVLLHLTIDRSHYGILVRAAVDNPGVSETIGINTQWIYVSAFTLGAVLAGLGGIVGAELLPMEPTYPSRYLVLMLAVVAVSGHGNLSSAFAASALLGVGSTAAKYFYPEYSSLVFFALMFLMLKLRPNGILQK